MRGIPASHHVYSSLYIVLSGIALCRLMRLCHRGVLQFIIVKPFVSILDVIMIASGHYYELPYQIFEFVVYNIRSVPAPSLLHRHLFLPLPLPLPLPAPCNLPTWTVRSYAWALYCMFVFYLATSKLIKKFRPVLKFATVKGTCVSPQHSHSH